MTTQSLLRTSQVSLPSLKVMNSSRKSILKRPASLPLSPISNPFPFVNAFSVLYTPGRHSPHVHFPPTPSLISTYVTHSSNVYDRAPIIVSPNPLELPPRGARTYSPSFADYVASGKGAFPVDVDSSLDQTVCISEDSPIAQTPHGFSRYVRFATLPPHSPLSSSQNRLSLRPLGSPYPRSPFFDTPSPPLTPADFKVNVEYKEPTSTANGGLHKKLVTFDLNVTNVPSPLRQSASSSPFERSPLAASAQNSASTPLDLNLDVESDGGSSSRLRKAFWGSVSVEMRDIKSSAGLHPRSAIEIIRDGSSTVSTPISAVPSLVMGVDPVLLWSPGLPRKRPVTTEEVPVEEDEEDELEDVTASVLSPSAGQSTFSNPARSAVVSPSPSDPFAAFPSFSAALLLDESKPTTSS
ncbi:hypothetical protein HGRIS_008721 [Hohenbuehelia grisea]|uniref:Uncharacterized protein n=1 Tax=Hohenbuehelia grisea TaxID=104357 RepID=A0ABR3J8U0_9AGAR